MRWFILMIVPLFTACGGGGGTSGGHGFGGPESIIRANCGTCHGADLEGGTSWVDPFFAAPALAGYPTSVIEIIVREGQPPGMPAIPAQEISDEALAELALHIAGYPATREPEPEFDVNVDVLDEDPWFDPVQVAVEPGAVVRFRNVGRTYHPVVDLDHLSTGGMHGVSSGNLGPGGTWFRRFDAQGTHVILCGHHPYMLGEIHVHTAIDVPVYAPNPPAAPPWVPGVGEIWVVCQFQDWPGKDKDGVVQVIDAATWAVTHLIPVGNNPHNLWFSDASTHAVVTSWFDTTVSVIDANTKTVLATHPVGTTPAHVISDHSSLMWFITMEGSNYVQAFTQAPGPLGLGGFVAAAPRAQLSGYGPHGIWYAPNRLVTANTLDSTFSIIDASTLQELALLPSGLLPLGAGAASDGTLASAGNYLGYSVSVYNLAALAHIRDIPVPGTPVQAPFTPDNGRIVVANGAFVSIIDAAKAADPENYPNPASSIDATIWTGRGAHGVAFGPKLGGGTYAYVSHKFENYISVIDLGSNTKVGDVPLSLTTTGKVALAGGTDTGANGISVRPNLAPWK